MGCPVLTQDRIDLLLKGTLPAGDRPVLLAHLSEPCADCLEILASPANEHLLARIAAHDLSVEESDRIFASAVAPASPAAPVGQKRHSPHWARRTWTAAVAAGALAAGAALISLKQSPLERQASREVVPSSSQPVPALRSVPGTVLTGRDKAGSPALGVAELMVLAAEPGRPDSLRIVPPRGEIGLREVVLFRVRLGASAYLTLLALPQGAPPFVLWPEGAAEQRGPGEFEIASAGQALSFDLRRVGGPGHPPGLAGIGKRLVRVAAIASPRPLSAAEVAALPSDPRRLAGALPGAAVGLAEVILAEGEGR
jgi:hypothetical protein